MHTENSVKCTSDKQVNVKKGINTHKNEKKNKTALTLHYMDANHNFNLKIQKYYELKII